MPDQTRPLPKHGDVVRFAQQDVTLTGSLAVVDLPCLAAEVCDHSTILFPELQFAIDDDGRRTAHCRVHGTLRVTCQRCLEPLAHEVDVEVTMAFVASDDEAKKLPVELEPVMLPENSNQVDLYAMLEEELLLNLPIAAFHERCEGGGATRRFGERDVTAQESTEKPFAALANLIGSKRDKQ